MSQLSKFHVSEFLILRRPENMHHTMGVLQTDVFTPSLDTQDDGLVESKREKVKN